MRLLQLSDVHFGRDARLEYQAAIARRIGERRYDGVVVVGDLTQRNFRWQFRAARAFLDAARASGPVLIVPGNHDVAWWWKPVGLGSRRAMYRGYRKWISEDLEPTLGLPGVTLVGLNSCHGVRPFTLTTRPRDVGVVGAVQRAQWDRARTLFATAPVGDLKVLVFHHNLLRGDLSQRWGLASREKGITDAIATGADLVLNGHDHQTRIDAVERGGRRLVVSASTTLCRRTRGGLPAAFQEIEVSSSERRIRACVWSDEARDFLSREDQVFPR